MRDGSNKKLIIISLLVMVCLLAFYKVTRYYQDKEIKPIIKDNVNVADESDNNVYTNNFNVNNVNNNDNDINVADESDHCKSKEYKCPSGYQYINTACCSGHTSVSPQSCVGNGGTVIGSSDCCKKTTDRKRVCVECEDGYTLNDGQCVESCSVIAINGPDHKSPNDGFTVSVTLAGTCKGKTLTVSYNSSSQNITIDSLVTKQFAFTTPNVTCKSTTVTASVTGGGSASKEIYVTNKWHPVSNRYSDEALPMSEGSADDQGKDIHGNCSRDGDRYYCVDVWSRSCGSSSYSDPPACYGNARLLSLVTKQPRWVNEPSVEYPFKISGVEKESDCKIPEEPSYCKPQSYTNSASNEEASKCEDNIKIETTDGMDCKGKPFYTINCENTINVEFDNGDDKENGNIITNINELYAGQGFKYGIGVTTKRTCTAEFKRDNWKAAYDYNSNKINQINNDLNRSPSKEEKEELEKKRAEANTKLEDLKQIVNDYNNFSLSKSADEKSTLEVRELKDTNDKSLELKSTLEVTTIDEGQSTSHGYSHVSEVSLGVSGVKNPKNYTWSSEGKPRVIKLIPPKAYIEKDLGSNKTVNNTNKKDVEYVDGGNKIYIDYYTKPNTYPISIEVTGLGGDSKITNDKCKLKVVDQEIIYRPIDLTNPFINSSWTPGKNWVNSTFDFRNIIDPNIWSK